MMIRMVTITVASVKSHNDSVAFTHGFLETSELAKQQVTAEPTPKTCFYTDVKLHFNQVWGSVYFP